MLTFVGFSPAWQQIYELNQLTPGRVHRAAATCNYSSGKATNAAIVATRYTNSAVHLATVVGGPTGQLFEADLFRHRLRLSLIRAETTRVCTTVIPKEAPATELIANASPTSPAVAEEMHLNVRRSRPTAIACCGSVPAGIPDDIFGKLIRLTEGPTIVDAAGPPLLAALASEPTLVKPNLGELNVTFGLSLADDETPSSPALIDAVTRLRDLGAQSVLVTNGPGPVILATSDGIETLPAPAVDYVVNPIGAGDALTGATLASLERGANPIDAVASGLEAAAEKCAQLRPEDVADHTPDV